MMAAHVFTCRWAQVLRTSGLRALGFRGYAQRISGHGKKTTVARKEAMEAVISPVVHPDRVHETLLLATHEISSMVLGSWWNQ